MLRLDAADGTILAEGKLSAAPSTSVLLTEHGVLVGTDRPSLVRLDPESLEITAERPLDGRPIAHLRLAGDRVIVLADEARTLLAIDPASLQTVWARPAADGEEWSSYRPHLYRDRLLAGDSTGELFALDPERGTTAWRWSLAGAVRGIGAADQEVYVGTIDGVITALTVPAD